MPTNYRHEQKKNEKQEIVSLFTHFLRKNKQKLYAIHRKGYPRGSGFPFARKTMVYISMHHR